MTTTVTSSFLPAILMEPIGHQNPDRKDMFERMNKEEILAYVEEAIRQKNPSTLTLVCQIPNNKFDALLGLTNFSELAEIADGEEIERFLKVVTGEQLETLKKILWTTRDTLEELLRIFIIKANNPLAKLAEKAKRILIGIPPLALVIAIRSGMDLVSLSKYMSPNQLRFLALYAPDSYIKDAITYLINNKKDLKLYTLLKALPASSTNPKIYTFENYVSQFNENLEKIIEITRKELDEAKSVKEKAEAMKIKARVNKNIRLSLFATNDELEKIGHLQSTIDNINSMIFKVLIAAFEKKEHLLSSEILTIDKLCKEGESLISLFS